ncbi:DUF2169 family type VI secretion system accessory protein [Tahibacter harae]|uniref:DUF2169 domain-containing protein n=1 Tax=Tahibacter harae TaxID=2963937 RepID=A0ABT1QV62_9GAMM|nr:DUF2169 domain-containing protein [Tahibacter harae]MCQ4166172.1 DUF2169 domain-containing protein [Tahibacter harae]
MTAIPAPRLRQLRNATPFPHLQFDKMGKGRRFHDVVIVCASFVLGNGRLQPAAAHRGPVIADRVWDESNAAVSSLRCATDILLIKPGSDVYVTGTVRALDERPCRDWPALLRVTRDEQMLIQKMLRFTGPRQWTRGLLGWSLSSPAVTTDVSLRYELAYGGWRFKKHGSPNAQMQIFEENPSGTGWFGFSGLHDSGCSRYRDERAVPGPQIEYIDAPIRSANRLHRVAGLGPIARHWAPRHRFAGTYGASWLAQFQREEIPDYPTDFDERYFHYAPTDQIVPGGLVGDEGIQLAGFFADVPAISAQLPQVWMEAVCRDGAGNCTREALRLDTLHVDLDLMLVHLTWRLVLDQSRDIVDVEIFDRLIANGRRTQAAFRGVYS